MTTNNNIQLLYVDLFSGAGGTSTGVETSGSAKVIACVNHDANAIASHAANHPDALHFVEDVRTLDLSKMTAHVAFMRQLHPEAKLVLWASLECTNFSKAKGGQPRDADSRTLAYSLFKHFDPETKRYFDGVGYIQALNPDYIQIENVEEFMSWGEMDENGKPISRHKGTDYKRFVADICSLGYHTDFRILNSADYGAYTSRKRLFLQFAKHHLSISWPEATHARSDANALKWKPVREVLDFTDEGVSIFERKKPLSDKTLERIYAGLIKFVAGGKDKWLLKYNSTNGKTGFHNPPSIDEPCPVVATQNRLGLVTTTFLSKYFSGHPDSKNISIDEPAGTITTKDHHSIVNCDFLSAYYGNGHNHHVDTPCPTITTKDRFSLIRTRFIDQQFGTGTATDIEKPLNTITTVPKYNLVSVMKWRYLMNPQFTNKGGDINKPCFTLIARMDKMPPYLVQAESGNKYALACTTDTAAMRKIKEFMRIYGIADIKMRMLKIPELKMIMGFPRNYVLIGTQAEQKKYIGNAVEVTMARVLCKATVSSLTTFKKMAV